MMQYGNPEPLIALALPMMYGLGGPNILLGWAIHQLHGIILAFITIASLQGLRDPAYIETLRGATAAAIVVGGISTLSLSMLLMPVWLGAVGYPFTPPVPDLAMPEKAWSIGGHILYALPVTVGYALLARR